MAASCKSSGSSSKAAAALVVILLALLAAEGSTTTSTLGCFVVGWAAAIINGKFALPPCNLSGGPGSNPFPAPKPAPTGKDLKLGYYNKSDSCPDAEPLVRKAVEEASKKDPTIGAGLIRLHFHDAFVRGSEASVLLNTTAEGNTDTERTGPPNKDSLRGFEVIDAAKTALQAACPNKVSCADILAFAARDAASILSNGKIYYDVPGGRLDGRKSRASETSQLPGPDSDVQQLEAGFAAQGLNLTDMVTLSAAHSIGDARCMFFSGRVSDMDPKYGNYLRDTCNAGGPSKRVNQDNRTANVLDNQYYKNIFDKFVLFKSDAVLNSSDTIDQVKANTADDGKWEKAFGDAMVKMGKIGVITSPGPGADGAEIRKECWKINE